MVLPMLASLLPGLAAGAKRFVSGVASDVMAGKGLGQSLKQNAISTANTIIPGAGSVLKQAIGGAQRLIAGKNQPPTGKSYIGTPIMRKLTDEIQVLMDRVDARGIEREDKRFPLSEVGQRAEISYLKSLLK